MRPSRKPQAAAIYARISQDRNGETLGIQRQEQLCREVAERNGWPVSEVYADNDLSAYRGAPRPAYQKLLQDMRSGAVDSVIVVDQDRLTRHTRELEEFIEVADHRGVALATASGDLDLSSSEGRFRARIMGAVARQESEKKSERIKRQREQAAQKGKPHGGRRAYGYEPDGLTVRAGEAELIREAAARFLAGESLRSIAQDWNRRGIRSASGGSWKVTSLRSLLGGPRIAGLRVHDREVVGDAAWPAIIDRETHERIRAVLGDPRRVTRGRPPTNLLTSMLECGRCGARMHATRRTDGSRRYTCGRHPGVEACGRMSVVAEPLEAEVVEQVLAVLADSELPAAAEGPGAGFAQAIEAEEAKLAGLARDFAEDRIGRGEWLAAREVIDGRLRELRRSVASAGQAQVLATLPRGDVDALRSLWDSREDVEWRRAVLLAVVDRVIVRPAAKRGRRSFDPDRAEVVWRA